MITPQNSEWTARDIEQATEILKHKVHPSQLERALDLCGRVAAESLDTLTYTAMCLSRILVDPPVNRTVITFREHP